MIGSGARGCSRNVIRDDRQTIIVRDHFLPQYFFGLCPLTEFHFIVEFGRDNCASDLLLLSRTVVLVGDRLNCTTWRVKLASSNQLVLAFSGLDRSNAFRLTHCLWLKSHLRLVWKRPIHELITNLVWCHFHVADCLLSLIMRHLLLRLSNDYVDRRMCVLLLGQKAVVADRSLII